MEKEQKERKYAYWRVDKPKEEGFSHELISVGSEAIMDQTDVDHLDALPFPGIDTLYKAFHRTVNRIPDNEFIGTRVGNEYKWITFREGEKLCKNLS